MTGMHSSLISGFTFFSVALATTIVFYLFYPQNYIAKNRMSRAVRRSVGAVKSTSDLPSIARARYSFLKNRKRNSGSKSFISVLTTIESLIYASGLKWRVSSFFIIVSFLVVAIAFGLVFAAQARLSIALFCAAPAAFFLALNFLVRRRARQLQKFQEIFPEALDLIVRSVRAGLPVSESIKMIGTEVAEPVGEAFRDVAANLGIGMSLDESLTLLQKKIPVAEVKFFAISLTIQQETGGNLAEILSNLASTMRKRVQIGKKIRALSSEAKASALIIGALPFLVGLAIYALNRSYIEVLFIDDTGRLFLFGALGSITAGAVVMAKLIRFEI